MLSAEQRSRNVAQLCGEPHALEGNARHPFPPRCPVLPSPKSPKATYQEASSAP